MNRWILRLLAGVAITQVGAAGGAIASQNTAVAPDEEAWQRTVSTNTLEAYAKFSLEFPQSQYALQARSHLTTLATPDADPEVMAAIDVRSPALMHEFMPNSIPVI